MEKTAYAVFSFLERIDMRIVDIIQNKRDNIELTKEEIDFLLDECQAQRVPDYQLSASVSYTHLTLPTNREV